MIGLIQGIDPAIFEEDVCVTEILQCADAPALEKITTRLRNEVQQLCTAKKTLLAENHQTFLSVGDLLEKVSA